MELTEIESRVKKVIGMQMCRSADTLQNAQTWDDLGADSLDTVEIVVAMEDEFEIEILNADAEKVTTIDEAISLIAKALNR